MTHHGSLRFRLLAAVLLAVTLTASFTLWGIHGDAHSELDELFDAQLEQLTLTHLGVNSIDDITLPDVVHPYTRKLLARHIWRDVRPSAIWDSEPTSDLPPHLDEVEGFGDILFHDRNWRYFGAWSADRTHHVLVMQDHAIREELASEVTQHIGLLSMIHGPILALLIAVLLTMALRPLRAVVLALSAPDPLLVKLPPASDLPHELAVVVEAFDRLIGRFRNLLERERHFAATAAHELRTPLAGLSAQLQVISMQSHHDPKAIAQAQRAVRHLGTLVDHLLLMARLDTHQVQARLEPVNLHELALEVAALVQDIWPQRDIGWDIPQSGDHCWQVNGDPTLLRVLLLNLLDNACKHGPARPRIAIRVRCSGMRRELTVEDNGPGIPPEWMSLLQQRFARASSGSSGLGIGLSLVREIALLHGGWLLLDHARLGGLRVCVTLPGLRPLDIDFGD